MTPRTVWFPLRQVSRIIVILSRRRPRFIEFGGGSSLGSMGGKESRFSVLANGVESSFLSIVTGGTLFCSCRLSCEPATHM